MLMKTFLVVLRCVGVCVCLHDAVGVVTAFYIEAAGAQKRHDHQLRLSISIAMPIQIPIPISISIPIQMPIKLA